MRGKFMSDERAASAAKRPRARKHRYYNIGPDLSVSAAPGYELENKSILPPYEVRRLPALSEPARFVFDKSAGRLPADLDDFYGWWIISDRAKALFEGLDPAAFVFVPCDVRVPHGSYNGPRYWLCDVVRVLDALDETQSHLTIGIRDDPRYIDNGKKFYRIAVDSRLVFKEAEIGKAHIFRMAYSHAEIICDQELKDAWKSAGLKKIWFDDVSKP